MVVNVNNWHWTDKNCLPWAKEYFSKALTGLEVTSDRINFKVTGIKDISGDCEVNQRKGKLMSLFDMQMILNFEASVESKDNVYTGSISIPEIAFDSEIDDYRYDISILKENSTNDSFDIKKFFKEQVKEKISSVFFKFNDDLLAENAKDIQLESDKVTSTYTLQNSKLTSSSTKINETPKPKETEPTKVEPTKIVGTKTSTKIHSQNTSSVSIEATFTANAENIYKTYLSIPMIDAWSRRSFQPIAVNPQGSDRILSKGDKFSLFSNNILCEIRDLKNTDPQKENYTIVMDWRLKDWVEGQYSKLELQIVESKKFGETKMTVNWKGVPIGQEERVKQQFQEVYIRSVKIIFGFGIVL
ncbi:unnamed protein product [Hanseniaspora opuntiae]